MALAPQFTRAERGLIVFCKGLAVLACAFVAWALLSLNFFVCCGISAPSVADPRVSPLGPVATVALVWPAIGLA